jgi:mannose/fructose/N-acetylgalactosamine-specific phosphotransferase system component IID
MQFFNVDPRNIHMTWQWTNSGKRLHMCEIVCLWRKCGMCTNWIAEEQKHWWILHENDTKMWIQQALSKNQKKMLYRHIPFFNTLSIVQALSRISSLSGHMNIARVNIEFFTGCKKIKQWHISFVLGYLHMILWKTSTAISIKQALSKNQKKMLYRHIPFFNTLSII